MVSIVVSDRSMNTYLANRVNKANKALSCKTETGPSHFSYVFHVFFPISDGV